MIDQTLKQNSIQQSHGHAHSPAGSVSNEQPITSISRREFVIASAGSGVMGLAGCLGSPDSESTVVRFGTLPIAAVAEVFIAEENGYFADRGIDLEIERISNLSEATPSVATGRLDVASGALGPGIFNSLAQDIPVRVVADQTQWWGHQPSGMRIWVRDGLYSEGVTFGDLPDDITIAQFADDYLWSRILQAHGLTWEDREIINLPYFDMIPAMASDEIDVCSIPDPLGLQLAGESKAQQLMYGSQVAPRMQIAVYVFGGSLLEDRPSVATRWLEAYLLGIRDYYEMGGFPDPAVASIISNAIDIPEAAIRSSIPSLVHKNGMVNAESIMSQQAFFACRGEVSNSVPQNEIINVDLLDAALDTVGRLDESEATPSVEMIQQWSNNAPTPYPLVGNVIAPEDFPSPPICDSNGD